MPRGPRLDAPGVLHHVMARGIEGRALFREDRDRADFVRRLAALAQAGAVTVYAWALLPNHVHLLVRSGHRPLSRTMRSLLTGYAGAFNRRHHRKGHLFQNRYKSVVVEEAPYFLELVRYLHLNPLRTGIVQDLRALDRYPWSGHAALVGRGTIPWQATRTVLARFAPTRRRAQAGVPGLHRRGGGARAAPRPPGGWAAPERGRVGRGPIPPARARTLGGRRADPWEQRLRGGGPARGDPAGSTRGREYPPGGSPGSPRPVRRGVGCHPG